MENLVEGKEEKTIFGILMEAEEKKCFLEDITGAIEIIFKLSLNQNKFFTWGSFVALKGYLQDDFFVAIQILSLPIDISPQTDAKSMEQINTDFKTKDESNSTAIIASEIHLDDEKTLEKIRNLLNAYRENPPKLFVLMGDFSSRRITSLDRYKEGFVKLASEISNFPAIINGSEFLLISGPNDISSNGILPRNPLSKIALETMKSEIERISGIKAKIESASSPCILEAFGRKAIIIRENLFSKLNRNCCLAPEAAVKPCESLYSDLLRSQRFLSPFLSSVQPLASSAQYWESLVISPETRFVFLGDLNIPFVDRNKSSDVVGTGIFTGKGSFVVWYCDVFDNSIEMKILNK